jgi:hypothetical protein
LHAPIASPIFPREEHEESSSRFLLVPAAATALIVHSAFFETVSKVNFIFGSAFPIALHSIIIVKPKNTNIIIIPNNEKSIMPPSSEFSSSSSSLVTLEITILRASGLAGKDRSLLSFTKTSDPFINIMVNDRIVHRTSVKNRTLEPVWNESFTLNLDDYKDYNEKTNDDAKNKVWLDVLDHDVITENDSMGSVVLFEGKGDGADLATVEETTKWYEIPADSAENACGKIQVRMGVRVDAT